MAREFFCPRCLERFGEESVRYRTRYGEEAAEPRLAYERGIVDWVRAIWAGDPAPIHRVNPRDLADRDARGVHAQCPHGHRMPAGAFDIPSIVVGLVGETSAGKTVYLGTLLEQLDRGRLLPYLDFTPDEYSERLQEEIFADFYRVGAVPLATAPNRSDARREAITRTARTGAHEQFHLSFFDASGEQNSLADRGQDNRFLYVADVVMHFITPEALGLKRRSPQRRHDQRQAWHATNAAVRLAAGAADRTRTHAAVIVIKSDDIDPAALDMLTDARADLDYGEGLSLLRAAQIIDQDSRYVRDVLRSTEDARVLVDRIEDAYRSVTYHLVSATGEPADGQQRFPHRRPQRVLDPLLAALVKLGLLDALDGRGALR